MSYRECVYAGCDGDAYRGGRGYCSKHYTRLLRHGSVDTVCKIPNGTPDRERFEMTGYEVVDGCWIWRGTVGAGGYGTLKNEMGRPEKAHRMAYRIYVGPIPEGAHLLHSCDTPQCVNPDHLAPGTRSDNMKDMWEKRRHPINPSGVSAETRRRMARRYVEIKNAAAVAREFGISITHTHRILESEGVK